MLRKKYTFDPNRNVHMWEVESEFGGGHLHIRYKGVGEFYGGIEIHYRSPPDYMKGSAPHHHDCFVTGGLCWHDGSSLGADIPIQVFDDGKNINHDYFFDFVESWMKDRGLINKENDEVL